MSSPHESSPQDMSLVRADERRSCAVTARLGAARESREQVELSESHDLEVTIVDYSKGGLGVQSSRFVPQGCMVRVSVSNGASREEAEADGRVQRVAMVDRGPSYYLGLSFTNVVEAENRVLDAIRSASGLRGA